LILLGFRHLSPSIPSIVSAGVAVGVGLIPYLFLTVFPLFLLVFRLLYIYIERN